MTFLVGKPEFRHELGDPLATQLRVGQFFVIEQSVLNSVDFGLKPHVRTSACRDMDSEELHELALAEDPNEVLVILRQGCAEFGFDRLPWTTERLARRSRRRDNLDERLDGQPHRKCILSGEVWEFRPSIPFWERLLGLEKPPPPPEDPLRSGIETAREHIDAVTTFLDGGERRPHVRVNRGVAKDTWPAVPPDFG